MKKLFGFLLLLIAFTGTQSQTKQETEVTKAVSSLISALEAGDRLALEELSSTALSYGHSNGRVENRIEFIEALASGVSDFINIKTSNQTISVTGKNAIVRHRLDAAVVDKGKQGEAHLNILLVFVKEKGMWKLLARQAAKIV
jgi:ketosteroid isomerase-like protein